MRSPALPLGLLAVLFTFPAVQAGGGDPGFEVTWPNDCEGTWVGSYGGAHVACYSRVEGRSCLVYVHTAPFKTCLYVPK